MDLSRLVQMVAEKESDCSTCGQKIVPGNLIICHGKGYAYNKGLASHRSCLWDDRDGPAPNLTWAQIENLPNAVRKQDIQGANPDRLLGAVERAKPKRVAHMYRGDKDAGMQLSPEMLQSYRKVLEIIGKLKDPFWWPVMANGQTWISPERRPKEQRPPADYARMFREKHA